MASDTFDFVIVGAGAAGCVCAEKLSRKFSCLLLEAGGDLYGQAIEVRFLARLRPELKFESSEALVQQVRRDVERARAYFSADRPPGETP